MRGLSRMMVLDWIWNGEEERWQFVFERQVPYIEIRWGVRRRKWVADEVVVSVVGEANHRDAGLCALVSSYAVKLDELIEAIAHYLPRRAINVYYGINPRVSVVHPPNFPEIRPYEIAISDLTRPKRVHVWVDTSYPDPYYTYEIIFEDMEIVDARGEFV